MAGAKPLVWINAFPGTGKYTAARELAKMFAEGEMLLIHNHSLIDPVEVSFSRDHPDYQKERRRARQAAFDEFVLDPATLSRTVVFTDFQSDHEPGPTTAREYGEVASRSGRPLVPVYLICDGEENARRLVHKDRTEGEARKLSDVELLGRMRSTVDLFRFEGVEALTIDVSRMSPAEAATQIRTFLAARQTGPVVPLPLPLA